MNDDEKILFAKRLITAMQTQGYEAKPSVLEREFNLRHNGKPVTFAGVSKWLKGTAMPSADKLLTLSKWLDVPPEELAAALCAEETDPTPSISATPSITI